MTPETRLVGLILEQPLAADAVVDRVTGDEFADPGIGRIFDGVMGLIAREVAVDAMTVEGYFPAWEVRLTIEAGHPLAWGIGDPIGVGVELADTIRAAHIRRHGMTLLGAARGALADTSVDPVQVLSETRTRLDTMIDATAVEEGGPMLLGDALNVDAEYDWIVPDLLERKDRLIVTGPEGSGKTMLMRQLAVCASSGLHPMTQTQVPPVNVLFVDVENTREQWSRTTTVLATRVAHMAARDARKHMRLECRGRLDVTKAADLALLHRWVDRFRPDILFLGPLYKLVPRAITNDDDAAPLITALDGLRDRGLTLVMEAHAGKATDSEGDRDMRPRGSSALMGWPEFGFGIRPLATDPQMSAVVRWRGDRDQRAWPKHLMRGGALPWSPANY